LARPKPGGRAALTGEGARSRLRRRAHNRRAPPFLEIPGVSIIFNQLAGPHRFPKMTKRHYFYISIVILLMTPVLVMIYQINTQRVGVTPDSVVYLCAADNLLRGNGLVKISGNADLIPMTHFPPLYPLLIAMGEFIGFKQLAFCGYINIVVFILNVIFLGFLVYKSTHGNIEASCFGSLLIISSYDILRAHICAMTDPIFILLTLSSLFTLTLYINKESTLYLIICSILVALSFLLRYVGLSLIITIIVGMLFLCKGGFEKKVSDCAIFLAISSMPMALWISRNLYLTGNPFNRAFGYHMLSLTNFPAKVGHILQRLGSLSFPVYISVILASVLIIILIGYFAKPSRKLFKDKLQGIGIIPCLMIIFIIAYLFVVIISVLFFDSAIYLGYRILLPIIVFGQLLIIILLAGYLSNKKLLIFVLIIIGCQLYRWDFGKIYKEELVYSGPQWTHSEIINKVNKLPSSYRIYTNGPDVIYFMTGKLTYATPEEIISVKNVPNPKKLSEIREMALNFNEGKSVLVWLDNITWRHDLVSKQSLLSSLMVTLFYMAPDGSISIYTNKDNLKDLIGEEAGDVRNQ